MTRLVVLTDEGPEVRGGVGTWVSRIAAEAARSGLHVTVASRRGAEVGPGVRRVALRGPSFGRWGGVWALAAAPDVLRADHVVAATWPVATTWVRAVPVTVVAHGSDVTRPTADPRGRRRVFAQAWRWGAVSRWVAAHVPRAARVVPAPVDPAAKGLRGPVWGFVGRAVDGKGGDTFVRWVAAAGARGCVIGDGPALAGWRDLAEELGADVTFSGELPRDEVAARISTFRLLAAPSRPHPDGSGGEGLSLAVLEAAAAGVPAVVTDVGGLPEAAGPAGLVVGEGTSPAEVADHVATWDPESAGERAREWLAAAHGSGRALRALLD